MAAWSSESGSTSEACSDELLVAVPGSARKESAVLLGLCVATDCGAAALCSVLKVLHHVL